MKTKRTALVAVLILIVLGVGVGAAVSVDRLHPARRAVPTVRVKRGDLAVKIYARGELRATRSAMLSAPPVTGALQIMSLAPTGTFVKQGDVVVTFDPSQEQYNLEQSRFDLEDAQQEILKSREDATVQAAKDKVDLLKAQFDVRKAQLEVSKNELVSAIDAKKNLLALDEAKRALAQLRQDISSRAVSNQAAIALNEEKRNKAQLAMNQAGHDLQKMRVTAPFSGLVSIHQNYMAFGGIMFSGMTMPEYRVGDEVQPGRVIGQILDVNQMEIGVKVNETDRANVSAGQPVEIRMDALPGPVLHGKVKTVAAVASSGFFAAPGRGQFDVTVELEHPDPSLRPGYTGLVLIHAEAARNVLYLPRQAVFEKEGKPVVYVKSGNAFQERPVRISHATDFGVALEGLKLGTQVALVDPNRKHPAGAAGASSPSPVTGGGAP
ncbi:MAG: efflux RND transporter periplasmic adaptor subunit [Terriglobia bacterium]